MKCGVPYIGPVVRLLSLIIALNGAMACPSSPSIALLRSLKGYPPCRRISSTTILLATRSFHVSSSRRQQEKSFKGQLYESVAKRLEREREEQSRFSKARGESSGGRTAATTFSSSPTAFVVSSELTRSSYTCRRRHWILSGWLQLGGYQAKYRFNATTV